MSELSDKIKARLAFEKVHYYGTPATFTGGAINEHMRTAPIIALLIEAVGLIDRCGCTHSRKDFCKHQHSDLWCDNCTLLSKLREILK